jgi:hypothetical protein
LNEQIGHEFAASVQYVAIAAHFDSESLPETGQALLPPVGRRARARSQIRQIHQRRRRPRGDSCIGAAAIALLVGAGGGAKSARWRNGRNASINALVDLVVKEPDHITNNFLQWFVTEQLEEVSSAETLLRIVQRAGEGGLLHVEDYLARGGLQEKQKSPAASD